MFVSAALRVAHETFPVRIRNMSEHGALIEGGALPPRGTSVELVRGALVARGRVAWVQSGKAGLIMYGHLSPNDWMSRSAVEDRQPSFDRVAEARLAMAGGLPVQPIAAPSLRTPSHRADGEELATLVGRLAWLGDRLSSDEQVVAAHHIALQVIDEVQQRLGVIGERLRR